MLERVLRELNIHQTSSPLAIYLVIKVRSRQKISILQSTLQILKLNNINQQIIRISECLQQNNIHFFLLSSAIINKKIRQKDVYVNQNAYGSIIGFHCVLIPRQTNPDFQFLSNQMEKFAEIFQGHNQKVHRFIISNINKFYINIDPEIGYIQGMNIICSVLIYHGTNYIDCFNIFKTLMISCGFRNLFIQNFALARKLSGWLKECLKYRCYDLYIHMVQQNGVNIEMFSIGWLIPMMGNIIPLSQMHLIINIFMEKGWTSLIKILLTMFLYLKEQILAINDEGQLMHMLCTQRLRKRQINWQEVIKSSGNIKNLPIFL